MERSSLLRLSFLAAASRLPGSLGMAAAERLFVSTARYVVPPRELTAMQAAEPVRVGSLCGWSWGRGKQTVLLVHGWNGRAMQLSSFAESLAARGYRVVGFDLGGHGMSPGRHATGVSMADDLLEIGHHFGSFRGIVAHSFGGPVTVLAMVAGLEAERLAFVGSPHDAEPWLDEFARVVGYDEQRKERLRTRLESRLGLRFDELNATHLAQAVDAPMLVVHDKDDREVAWRAGQKLATGWGDATLVTTDGLGHRRILRDPDVVAQVVRHIHPFEKEPS